MENYITIKLSKPQAQRLSRYLKEEIEQNEDNFGRKQNFISLSKSVDKAFKISETHKEADIDELLHKIENQRNRIKQQNLSLERHKKYKSLLIEILEILSIDSGKFHSTIKKINDTLFGKLKKDGGTISVGTRKKIKSKIYAKRNK